MNTSGDDERTVPFVIGLALVRVHATRDSGFRALAWILHRFTFHLYVTHAAHREFIFTSTHDYGSICLLLQDHFLRRRESREILFQLTLLLAKTVLDQVGGSRYMKMAMGIYSSGFSTSLLFSRSQNRGFPPWETRIVLLKPAFFFRPTWSMVR